MERTVVNPWTWQNKSSFDQGIVVTDPARILFVSGQTSVDAEGKAIHLDDMRGQIHAALDNVAAVLAGAGMNLANIVRITYYVTDLKAFKEVTATGTLRERLRDAGCRPTATMIGVTGLADPACLIEIEATAVA